VTNNPNRTQKIKQ